MTTRKSAPRPGPPPASEPAAAEPTAGQLAQTAHATDLQRQIDDLVAGNEPKRPPTTLREIANRPETYSVPDGAKPPPRPKKKRITDP